MTPLALLISPRAVADLEDAWSFVADAAEPHVADAVVARIHAACARLRDHPELRRQRDELGSGVRSLVVAPWVVFYRARGDAIEIVRVLHGRRDVPTLLG